MEIKDSFVREMVSVLNSIAIENGSKNRFESIESITNIDGDDYADFALLYKSKSDDEHRMFVRTRGVITEETVRENILDQFKEALVRAIAFAKDYMAEDIQIRSMRTILSKPRIDRKLFKKYEDNLEVDQYYEDLEIQIESR